ncbi:hypothetical protein M5E86_07600 [Blautia wexlerae]|nr:hypothetical protein M5E86_07600 [Blautia wexlerae]
MRASTSDNISSYVSQISASQEEAAALTAEINNADNSIAQLVQQAEEEKSDQRGSAGTGRSRGGSGTGTGTGCRREF